MIIYGKHAIMAALQAKRRKVHRVITTATHQALIKPLLAGGTKLDVVDKNEIYRYFRGEAPNHQGIIADVGPLPSGSLSALPEGASRVAILDEISDIHNIGAIMRNAYAFGMHAVVVAKRFEILAKPEVSKTSSGYIDFLNVIEVTNISEAMRSLKKSGFWIYGLQIEDSVSLAGFKAPDKIGVVLGAEGEGLRRLTQNNCDGFLRIDINPGCESLNVSAASAIAFYAFRR